MIKAYFVLAGSKSFSAEKESVGSKSVSIVLSRTVPFNIRKF
jgi:hypothetical protein